MFKTIVCDWLKQYLPILINSLCTAVCVALAGCRLTADKVDLVIDYPAKYSNVTTNSISR